MYAPGEGYLTQRFYVLWHCGRGSCSRRTAEQHAEGPVIQSSHRRLRLKAKEKRVVSYRLLFEVTVKQGRLSFTADEYICTYLSRLEASITSNAKCCVADKGLASEIFKEWAIKIIYYKTSRHYNESSAIITIILTRNKDG